jgi:hypothetical protein
MANILGTITVDEVDILEVDSDPSAAAGTPAPTGSLGIVKNVGGGIYELWQKTGVADTAWEQFKTSGGGGGIKFGYNGNANSGRYMEMQQNISSNTTPYHPPTDTILSAMSVDISSSTTVTFQILKNDVQIDTLVITAANSGEKIGLNHTILTTDKIKVKVLSGSASQPILYLYFG